MTGICLPLGPYKGTTSVIWKTVEIPTGYVNPHCKGARDNPSIQSSPCESQTFARPERTLPYVLLNWGKKDVKVFRKEVNLFSINDCAAFMKLLLPFATEMLLHWCGAQADGTWSPLYCLFYFDQFVDSHHYKWLCSNNTLITNSLIPLICACLQLNDSSKPFFCLTELKPEVHSWKQWLLHTGMRYLFGDYSYSTCLWCLNLRF